jgi:tetratricopeptide (TPR) repeat protein
MKRTAGLIAFSLLCAAGAIAQSGGNGIWGSLPAGPFAPGFRLIEASDPGRSYPADTAGSMKARPLRVYLWYPADRSGRQEMKLEDYVRLAAEDFKPAAGAPSGGGSPAPKLPVPLAKGYKPDKMKSLLASPTAAFLDAKPAAGKFPLLLLGQGLFYESPAAHFILCEFLAGHGYIVATCPLLGTQYRLVNINIEDLETEIRDMESVLAAALTLPGVDPAKLGIIGYDLGGMAGLVLAMRNPAVQCFLSMDAGILDKHPSGLPLSHPQYREERFRIPWMHLTQARAIRPAKDREAAPSLYERKAFGPSYLVHVPTTNHGQFSSYMALGPTEAAGRAYWGSIESDPRPTYEEFCGFSLAFFDRYLKQDGRTLETRLQAGRGDGSADKGWKIEYKPGLDPPPSEAQLVDLIIEKGIRAGGPEIERARTEHPDRALIQESVLDWLGYHFLNWWGREEEAIGVFELNASLYPASWNAHDSLGEALLANGRTDEAVRSYRKSLELNPDNANGRAVLARLGKLTAATVPFVLDHNRMIVEAEFQGKDGNWHKARLWVDTGNPAFMITESFARKLGLEIDAAKGRQEIAAPTNVRLGGMPIRFDGVKSSVNREIQWLFNTMHNDGNLPSTVLSKYHVVLDYPAKRFTMAEPGILKPRGVRSPASLNPATGIIQMDAVIDGEKCSFALDNGASSSFVSEDLVSVLSKRHPDWPNGRGAAGCANIWGMWPEEGRWPMLRLPEIQWGNTTLPQVVLTGLPAFFGDGKTIAHWYSQKTARPVNGFLGPNAFNGYRVEIDYKDGAIYLEKGPDIDPHDMDIVRLTLKPLNDGRYQVIGVLDKGGKMVVPGVEPGAILLQVSDLKATGATMGSVVDALRGNPGDIRVLKLERDGKQFAVKAKVERVL